MKVLLFRTNGNKLDITKYNSQEIGLAKALRRKGIDCDVAYYTNKKNMLQTLNGSESLINVYWIKGYSIAGNGLFFGIKKILDKYDVIQVSEYDQISSLWLSLFSRYRRKVVVYHGPYITEYNKKYQLKCRVIDHLPISKKRKSNVYCFAKSVLAKAFLIDRGYTNVVVTGVGLDISSLNVSNSLSDTTRNIVNFMKNNYSLLYIGNIEPRRNTKFLINVMRDLIDIQSNISLVIVGKGNELYKKECEDLIREYGLEDNIRMFDRIPQDQIGYLYKEADTFLLPTSYEIYGMVMMEAMYYGVPVITTSSGGSLTVIDSGENGFIVELEKDEWKKQIIDLYDNPNLCERIGTAGRRKIIQSFTWDKISETMISTYKVIDSAKNLY